MKWSEEQRNVTVGMGRRSSTLLALLLAVQVEAAARTGLQCYTNGNGVDPPTLNAKKVYCAPDEWCVAENHYGNTAASLWPLDESGEKCYRMCKKVTTDSTWESFYQDAEQTIRVFKRDNSDMILMTCYQDLCNEHCLDDDAAAGLVPSILMFALSFGTALLTNMGSGI